MKNHLARNYTISYLTLLSGLSISAVAIYYSVIGLISIFSGAAVPIMIMGTVLETSKLVATVWLKNYWDTASSLIVVYLTISIMVLMLITSVGIFGFLSRAHSEQAIPTGDIVDKVSLIDEQIKTQRENIDEARKALTQLNVAVDQIMSRSTSENGASRAVQIRRTQSKERKLLQGDIEAAQLAISTLNNARAPIAKDLRKIEAEVGPIKYIAALIYGDVIDTNLLERAVRWMIILIVSVFDPLAIILLLACQHSFTEIRKQKASDEVNLPISETKYEEGMVQLVADNESPTTALAAGINGVTEIALPVILEGEENNQVSSVLVNNISGDAAMMPPRESMVGFLFPARPTKGQQFTRTDYDPQRDFLFDGVQWVTLQ